MDGGRDSGNDSEAGRALQGTDGPPSVSSSFGSPGERVNGHNSHPIAAAHSAAHLKWG